MKPLTTVFIIVFSITVLSCTKETASYHSKFILQEGEIQELRHQAIDKNDVDAAYKLFQHYSSVDSKSGANTIEESLKWLDMACALGHSEAIKTKEYMQEQ